MKNFLYLITLSFFLSLFVEAHENEHQKLFNSNEMVPIDISVPRMNCKKTMILVDHCDVRSGEIQMKIDEVMGEWSTRFPVTDEDKKSFEEAMRKSIPYRQDLRAYAFGRELLSAYVLQYCKKK